MSKTPWGPLGYITFKRTYARRLKEDDVNSNTEEFNQAVDRVINATRKQLKIDFSPEEEQDVREMLSNLEASVAGRFWWQLGTKTVDRLGLPSLQNCAACVVDSPRAFTWAFDLLMLGAGVGYNIQREYVYKLPKVKKAKIIRHDTKDADFIVPDSREGWVELLDRVFKSHFETGKGFSYSTILVRSKGASIKGFGGTASGPEELCWGVAEISKILNSRNGKQLRPIDCLDIMNIIGYVVVAGNVRRSAQLALGDADDLQFLNAKRWDLGNVPNWRAMSNNSVVCNDFSLLPEQFWNGYNGTGEPYGLINLKMMREVGRTGDSSYPDSEVIGTNPCCFSRDSKVSVITKSGIKDIKDVTCDDLVWVDLHKTWARTSGYFNAGVQEVFEVVMSNNDNFEVTLNHKFMVITDNNSVPHLMKLEKLEVGAKVVLQAQKNGQNDTCVITSITPRGKKATGCIEVPYYGYFTANTVISGNSEQTLNANESCCLSEIFLPNIVSKERLLQVAKNLYRICKHSLALHCSIPETESIVHKNMRMGIGITGYLQATEEQRSWLSDVYNKLREYDKEYSKKMKWPESIKISTIKPSGTLSLLAGVSPGCHPHFSRYYIRRIRVGSNSPIIELAKSHGYDIEPQQNFDGTNDNNTMVISFPVAAPEHAVIAKDMTAISQLEVVAKLQREWSDNAVSCTVYYKKEELPEIRSWLALNYNNGIKAVSFLLHAEHGFKQAPYEEITKTQYDEYSARVKPITKGTISIEDATDLECATGFCPVK